jgi:hypothetical protein
VKEHIKVLNKFKESPLAVLNSEKDRAKLLAAINKSVKLLQKHDSKNKK